MKQNTYCQQLYCSIIISKYLTSRKHKVRSIGRTFVKFIKELLNHNVKPINTVYQIWFKKCIVHFVNNILSFSMKFADFLRDHRSYSDLPDSLIIEQASAQVSRAALSRHCAIEDQTHAACFRYQNHTVTASTNNYQN